MCVFVNLELSVLCHRTDNSLFEDRYGEVSMHQPDLEPIGLKTARLTR